MINRTAVVIINEQHTLLPEQEQALREYKHVEYLRVPAEGWTRKQQRRMVDELIDRANENNQIDVVFVSPLPFMIREIARFEGWLGPEPYISVKVFHNDRREKRELPGGKVVYAVPQEGWELV